MSVKYIYNLNRTYLDEVSTTRPVIIFSYDLYHVWANTLALKNAGILYRKYKKGYQQLSHHNLNFTIIVL